MEIGVCTTQDSAMIRKVTQIVCGSPGSVSVAFQLVKPDGWISPIPSHVVKLKARTPSRGTTPNARNIRNAGTAIHTTEPLRPPLEVVDSFTRATGGASVVIYR